MSKGSHKLKRTRTPLSVDVQAPTRRVWLVRTEKQSKDEDTYEKVVRAAAQQQGWQYSVRHTTARNVKAERNYPKELYVLEPTTACEIYQDAHLINCLVILTHAAHVQIDPSCRPRDVDDLAPLDEFFAYKASLSLIRDWRDVAAAISDFANWPSPAESCVDHNDPRALPLHIFDGDSFWGELDEPEQRKLFKREYEFGSLGTRRDFKGHLWKRPKGRHGLYGEDRVRLCAAGLLLAEGYHWDVDKFDGKPAIITESEVWTLARGDTHVNIYPNGKVRGNIKEGAKLVWSAHKGMPPTISRRHS